MTGVLIDPCLHAGIVDRRNPLQHISPMRGVVFRVEPHAAQRPAEGRFHRVHLCRGKRAAFQDGAIAQQHPWVEMLNKVVLRPRNGRRRVVIGDERDVQCGEVLCEPVCVPLLFLSLLLHARER